MQLYFAVPDTATTHDGVLVRSFLRQCAVSTDLARAVKFRGGGFFADGEPVLANRRIFQQIEEMEEEAASKEKELYDLKHELIASQIKLDNTEKSLRTLQQDQQESSRQIVRLETEIRGMKDKK